MKTRQIILPSTPSGIWVPGTDVLPCPVILEDQEIDGNKSAIAAIEPSNPVPSQPDEPSVQVEPEPEDKPIAPAGAEESEDTHGGNEATNSIEDSPSLSEYGKKNRDENETGADEQEGKSSNDQGQPGFSAGNEDEAVKGKGNEKKTGTGKSDGDQDGSGGDAPENADPERQTGDGTGEAPRNAEVNQDDQGKGQDREEPAGGENPDLEPEEQFDDGEETDDQANSAGDYNADEIVKHEYVSVNQLKFAFYKLVDDLADQRAGEEPGHDVLSMKRLVRRALDKRPLEKCRVHLIREDIIVILDDSGSMAWWANLLNALATLCVRRKDVRVFWAPNGTINDPRWERQQGRGSIKIEPFPISVQGINIIYVGDFDGGDTPYTLAKAGANVAWYCPEERYDDTSEHNWCHHALVDYPKHVQYFKTLALADLLRAFKKTRRIY